MRQRFVERNKVYDESVDEFMEKPKVIENPDLVNDLF